MRVAIIQWTSGGLSGGSLKYLREVLPRLTQHPDVRQLAVWVPQKFVDELTRLLSARVYGLPEWVLRSLGSGSSGFWAQHGLQDADVVLLPCARLLPLEEVPQVVMLRNMEPPLVPFWVNPWRETLRNWARCQTARRACRKAHGVIAVSDYVRRFLVERWSIPERKIRRIYHGVTTDIDEQPPAERFRLGGPFVLTAGSLRPARGLEDLMGACGVLATQGLRIPIVIAGDIDPGMERYVRRLHSQAQKLRIQDQLHWTGKLSNPELNWLMRRCRMFVVTSRAEACPNTVLEAMAAGCRIVAARQDPMPEILQETADYYTPGACQELAQCMKRIWNESSTERSIKCDSAQQRARLFSWDTTAHQTVAFLKEFCG